MLRIFVRKVIRENWDEQYKKGSNVKDFGFDDDSKSLYQSKKVKTKIKSYLQAMGLLSKAKKND